MRNILIQLYTLEEMGTASTYTRTCHCVEMKYQNYDTLLTFYVVY